MKRILSLFIASILVSLTVFAHDETPSCSHEIDLDFERLSGETPTVHRAPLHVYIHAYYDASTNTIEIIYDGETEGEVYIYLNDMLIDYDSNIHTTFNLPAASGNYTIEIITDSWTAYGYLKI